MWIKSWLNRHKCHKNHKLIVIRCIQLPNNVFILTKIHNSPQHNIKCAYNNHNDIGVTGCCAIALIPTILELIYLRKSKRMYYQIINTYSYTNEIFHNITFFIMFRKDTWSTRVVLESSVSSPSWNESDFRHQAVPIMGNLTRNRSILADLTTKRGAEKQCI